MEYLWQVVRQDAQRQQEKKNEDTAAGATGQQQTLQDTIRKTKPYNRESEKYKKITQKLAVFIAAGNVANRLIENEEFRELLKELDDRYPVPGHTAIEQEMNKLLIDLKSKMKEALENARKVAITTDIWSKKGLASSYLGITAHFFSRKDHRRHCMTLAVRRLPSPHTGDRIEQLVCEVLDEWTISPQKVSAILTDNGSNMVCAFRDWVSESRETQMDLERILMLKKPHLKQQEVPRHLLYLTWRVMMSSREKMTVAQ